MDHFTRSDLDELMAVETGPCVSLFMPTHRTGPEIREDSLRCKNLCQEAEEKLVQLGHRAPTARDLLKPVRDLPGNEVFWKNQSDGLAIFVAPGVFKRFRLPMDLEERVVAADRFYIKPLLPLLQGDGRFYLLAASQNQLRLFEGSHYRIEELEAHNLPKSLQDALNIDEYREALQFHSGGTFAPGPGTVNAPMYHGQGSADLDVQKRDEILQYFHRVDAGLREMLHEQRIPLVFAGVDYLFPIFREASDYRALVEKPVTGNPDGLSAQELHRKAWEVVQPLFERQQTRAREKYAQHAQDPLASSDLSTIVDAAREGRVETLFVARNQPLWGRIEERGVTELGERESRAEDITNYAAAQTLLCNGAVYVLPLEEMPDERPMVAVFRYASVPTEQEQRR